MRPLTVVQLLPALVSGGVERSTLEIAEALVRAGHRSVVVSAGGRLLPALLATGSEHITLDIGRKSLATLRHVPALRRLFAQLRPDVVHARSRLPAWLARLALGRRSAGGPAFVTTVHGLNSPGAYSGIMARGDLVVCVSETVRAHVLERWPRTAPSRLRVIEPGIDPAVFAWSELPPADGRAPLLLMPGRGTRLKGHADALRLLAGLRAGGLDARLWLLGTREPGREAYVRELEALARSLDVHDAVQIDPPSADVVAAYRRSDLVLQLSVKPEAFGRTVVEALCSGRPVLGWAHGGVGELLARHFPPGAVPLGDHAALLAAARALLTGAPDIARIQAQTLAAMQEQTLKAYESISA